MVYLRNYLTTMFQISDVLIYKKEIAMVFSIKISLSNEDSAAKNGATLKPEVYVSKALSSVSKSLMKAIVRKMAGILDLQGASCFRCPKARYKLYPLSNDWEGKYLYLPREVPDKRIEMVVYCENDK